MSKEVLVDKYGNEFVRIEVKYNDKLQSIVMNDWRIGGCKWNDIDNGKFITLLVNKKDLINQLGVNKQISDLEAKLAESFTEKDVEGLIKDREDTIKFLKQQLFESGLKTLEEIKLSEQRKKMLEDLSTKNWELEHQLAEKEKESLKYFNEYRAWKSKCELLEQDQTKILETNQGKISFCIEKLVNIQKYISDNAVFVEEECFGREINDFIDNQIKQLKEMK